MNTPLPSVRTVSTRLKALKLAELEALAQQSGVPFATLLKIRMGTTPNPGLETVRKFYNLLDTAISVPAHPATPAAPAAQAAQQGVANA